MVVKLLYTFFSYKSSGVIQVLNGVDEKKKEIHLHTLRRVWLNRDFPNIVRHPVHVCAQRNVIVSHKANRVTG